jgi:DNA-binding response OmpR family regulator
MSEQPDIILIVDDDPDTRALLKDQVLAAPNFRVIEAPDGPDALQAIRRQPPDLIILDLVLPGLSGRDMLVALRSQGYRGPLIALAESKTQGSALESFRLGATDYITKPLREAEVLAAVERGLGEVRLRRQRDQLVTRLKGTNQQLERRVKELTTLYDIGQAAAALDNLDTLFRHALESATILTGADLAFLLLRDEKTGQFVLRAGQNLPLGMLDRMGEVIQDSVAEMVLSSRESLALDSEGLKRFATLKGLHAVLYVPLLVQTTVIGVLAVAHNQKSIAFTAHHGQLLRALANYTAMAIISTRLSYMLEQRSNAVKEAYRDLRERDTQRGRHMQMVLAGLHQPLVSLEADLIRLAQTADAKNIKHIRQQLVLLSQRARQLITQVSALGQRQGTAALPARPQTEDET